MVYIIYIYINGTKDIYYHLSYIRFITYYNVVLHWLHEKNGEEIVSSSSRNLFDLSTGLPINIYTVHDSALCSIIHSMYNIHIIIRLRPTFRMQP